MARLDPDRWKALSPYLDDVIEMPAGEREAWLAAVGAQNPELASDLQALIAEHAVLDGAGFLAAAPRRSRPPSFVAPLAGQIIGAYTLISRIGEGGMGTVWLARRSDGRFEGRAAVKLLDASLIGREGEERFIREGTILARLTHPAIAHLIDAGVSPTGQPYLVLEHVQGEHIDRYCDNRDLDVGARIRLFLDVLMAVAHAHAHLVVHRDIKPSNVLVRTDDPDRLSSAHRVKLLDFGIAKLLGPDADAIALTRDSGWALTPGYAAPEQLTGGAVTTATDVYSLGVLLYVLLGGQHPAAAGLHSPAALIEVVVDKEPPRLSEAVSRTTACDAETLTTNAARRHTTLDSLRRTLQGDLDTIVATALKKNPQERYPSVTAFADDLRRYLDHQPIAARPDTLSYRTAKFVRRHRVPVALATLAVATLAAGLIGTETQRRRADHEARAAGVQRDFAWRELSRAEAINDLNVFLLSDAAPSGKPFTVGELLAHAEDIVDRPQGESPQNRVEMLVAIGRQYQLQDEHAKARRVLARAYDLARTLPEPATRAKASCAYASAIALAGESDRAEALFQNAQRELPSGPEFALHRIACLMRGSELAQEGGQAQVGVARAEAAQRILKQSPQASALLNLSVSMRLAESYRLAGRNREAIASFEQAYAHLASLGRGETERAGTLLNNWGMALYQIGRPLEAEAAFRRAIRISSTDGTEHSVSPMLLNNLARALWDLHQLPEAKDYAERAYAKARRVGHEIVINQSLTVRGETYRDLGDLGGAAGMLAELEPRLNGMLPAGHAAFASLASERALLAEARADLEAARAAADRAVAIADTSQQRLDYLPRMLRRRASLALQMQRPDEASADAARALAMERDAAGPGTFSANIGRAQLVLGRALLARGKRADAQAALASALEHLTPTLGTDHPETRLARQLADAPSR